MDLGRPADVALLLVYGAVAFFFLMRFARWGKWPSFYLALTGPLGWTTVAMWDLGIFSPHRYAPLRWAGVVVGIFMLSSLVRWDRRDPGPRE